MNPDILESCASAPNPNRAFAPMGNPQGRRGRDRSRRRPGRAAGRMTSEAGCCPVPARHKCDFGGVVPAYDALSQRRRTSCREADRRSCERPAAVTRRIEACGCWRSGAAESRSRGWALPGDGPPGRLSSRRHGFLGSRPDCDATLTRSSSPSCHINDVAASCALGQDRDNSPDDCPKR